MEGIFLDWDGTSTDYLVNLFTHTNITPSVINSWIDLSDQQDIKHKRGATWLVKEALKSKFILTEKQTIHLLEIFIHSEDWETRLHILQSFKYLDLTCYNMDKVYEALKYTLHSDIKFLRAWSYDAFYRIALVDDKYQQLFHDQLTWGIENESGSIKARIKNIVKEINKAQHAVK